MLHVENARYVNFYNLEISFNDGSIHLVDLEKVILNDKRPIVAELKDKNSLQILQSVITL